MPWRSSSARLISSQRSRTRPAVFASASPKTCGSRRSRSVSSCRSTSASARLTANVLRRRAARRGDGRAGIRVRLVPDLVLDLRVAAVVLLRVLDPFRHLLVLLLLLELLLDRVLHLAKRCRLRGLDGGERLDDVVAVLRVNRLGELAFLERERRLVERRYRLT